MSQFLPNVVVSGFSGVYQELAHLAFVLALFSPHSSAAQALEE